MTIKEQKRQANFERRQQKISSIVELANQGYNIKQIAATLKFSRRVVTRCLQVAQVKPLPVEHLLVTDFPQIPSHLLEDYRFHKRMYGPQVALREVLKLVNQEF